ncbi:polysaccharide deacetylase family protein [Sphingomonas cavernae]|uniref:WalW protein n=1 Tax=Sphingomonas cavernae TaxID=2320861 RepID=A0A418WMX4_9SPHN|nr:polysaccharide deacetylase family protein [Sphingomonas cavernae]RJF91364.1 WalW protein [Sphingomonas cavernae]
MNDGRLAVGQGRLDIPPPKSSLAAYPAADSPRFLVFVDTEEEFDWRAPISRDAHSTHHVRAIPRLQEMFDAQGISPTYLVDQPIVESDAALAILRPILDRGGCAIGAQLHPWVSPPFDEALTTANSFAGNLPSALERAKITGLTQSIAERFGRHPSIYRAGRYGIGPNSAAILEDLSYRLDVSVRAGFDYANEGGPDFTGFTPEPFWAGPSGRLLALPLTTAYVGALRRFGSGLNRLALRQGHVRGLLARTGLFTRVPLTPEGVSAAEAKEAIRVLAGEGLRIFSLSFHSPSLEPGHTQYVRDAADLKVFYRWWDEVIALFHKLAIAPCGGEDFVDIMANGRPKAP